MKQGVLLTRVMAAVAMEAAANTTITSVTTTSRTSYTKDNDDVRKLTQSLIPSGTFFRVEKVTRKTKNDGAWMNFPTVSLFSSTANKDLTNFFKSVGCEGNTNAYSITGSTPLIDSLFSVRYGLYSSEQEGDTNLMLLEKEEDTYLYRRLDTLPVGFMVAPDMDSMWQRDLGNPATVQNALCDAIGADQVLTAISGEGQGNRFEFTPDKAGDFYVYIGNRSVEQVEVQKGEDAQTFKNVNRGFLLELGWCKEGEPVVLTSETEEDLRARVYRFEFEGLHSVYEILNRYPLTVTKWTDTILEGTVETEKAGTLFTSIPYDAGWTVTVDGQVQTPHKIFDAFLSVDLTEGTHTIVFSYEPEGLRTGALITLGSMVLLAAALVCGKVMEKRRKAKRDAAENETENEGE